MASSSPKSGDTGIPLEEIVFSCGVCQATVSELYASKDSNLGFHSGSGNDDGVVTKLWIADCSHITCAKHLEGGGKDTCVLFARGLLTISLSGPVPSQGHATARNVSSMSRTRRRQPQRAVRHPRTCGRRLRSSNPSLLVDLPANSA